MIAKYDAWICGQPELMAALHQLRGGDLTLEVVLTESPRHLHKRKDAESGLALIAAEE